MLPAVDVFARRGAEGTQKSQMAYNKSKLVANAQKLLHQGKVAQAIQEYVQILKHEPKDQATLMTVGDLYVRQGDTSQALEYFERLAQIYLADGFVTKAIAIYKKIAKLAPEETRPVEKLAELYVQQGVLSEARPIYLQLAELHQRAGRQPQAAALLRKLLEAEPDNLRVLTRVAELALAMNQPGEAATAFRSAAEQLHNNGNHAEAIKYVDRALKIDPKDAHVLTIKARALSATGQNPAAVALLRALPELETRVDTAELLIELYLQEEQTKPAIELASKLFARNSANMGPLRQVAAKVIQGSEPEAAIPLIDLIRAAMIEKGEHEALAHMLTAAGGRLPDKVEIREWLVEVYKHTNDSAHLPGALAELAAICITTGDRDRSLQVYEEILERDPNNETARLEYEKLKGKTAGKAQSKPVEKEPPRLEKEPPRAEPPLSEKEPPAPPKTAATTQPITEPELDEETQRFVTQALTDIDLFASYGLTQKAIDLLEVVLQRVPGHAQTLERLLDHYLGAGDEKRTAELAAQLEQIHTERGNSAAAERFTDLRRRFENAARITEEAAPAKAPAARAKTSAKKEPLVREFSVEPEPEEADEPAIIAPVEAAEIPEAEIPEIDIAETPAQPTAQAAVHELDLSEEWAALATELDDEAQAAPAAPAESSDTREPAAPEFAALDDLTPSLKEALRPAPSRPTPPRGASNADFTLELETPQAADRRPKNGPTNAQEFLEALSSDLDAALPSLKANMGGGKASNSPPDTNEAVESVSQMSSQDSDKQAGPLSEIFDQFRSEVGELGAEDEDLETHYNLGIAYREMGLIEEAISEFQKVAKGNKGQAFRYAMQCCTLLGLAFMEKGQPAIAATWYERALAMPALDQETILALRYDLGVAQELAGDMAAARKSFSQVYGMNIDYRDVAERLSSLGNER
jgi:pilus assembly protein FimV